MQFEVLSGNGSMRPQEGMALCPSRTLSSGRVFHAYGVAWQAARVDLCADVAQGHQQLVVALPGGEQSFKCFDELHAFQFGTQGENMITGDGSR